MAKKKKAKKTKLKMPKLSFVDKLIYGFLYVLVIGFSALIMAMPLIFSNRIAFADPLVVASDAHASTLWALAPMLTFFLMGLILLELARGDRYPIFGQKGIQYGPPKYPKIYPLFMKNKPKVWVSENSKQYKKTIAIVLVVILLLSFIPYPWSFYGRDCLYKDGSIGQYSMFNTQNRCFLSKDITAVKIETTRRRSRKHRLTSNYSVTMTLTTNMGKSYSFGIGDFGPNNWLWEMIALKGRYDSQIITYEEKHPLETVIREYNLSEEEAALLYQLFDIEKAP